MFSLVLAANCSSVVREEEGPTVVAVGSICLLLLNAGENRQLRTQSLVLLQRKLARQGLDKVMFHQLRECDTLTGVRSSSVDLLSNNCCGESMPLSSSSRSV